MHAFSSGAKLTSITDKFTLQICSQLHQQHVLSLIIIHHKLLSSLLSSLVLALFVDLKEKKTLLPL